MSQRGERPHAVVIGSGFGGLAAAIRLGARGWRVTVLDKLDGPGGRAYTYRRDGFTFATRNFVMSPPNSSSRFSAHGLISPVSRRRGML